MALRTHFNQSEIGCPGVAEFTVQRTEALFDYITGFRQKSVAFGLRFRQRAVAVGFAHNAVQQLMLFQVLPVFRTVVAFVGIDGRIFGQTFQQRRQVFALMGIGGGNLQFLDILGNFAKVSGYLKMPYNEKAACTLEISKCRLLFLGNVWSAFMPTQMQAGSEQRTRAYRMHPTSA